jgi:hypothetical protein
VAHTDTSYTWEGGRGKGRGRPVTPSLSCGVVRALGRRTRSYTWEGGRGKGRGRPVTPSLSCGVVRALVSPAPLRSPPGEYNIWRCFRTSVRPFFVHSRGLVGASHILPRSLACLNIFCSPTGSIPHFQAPIRSLVSFKRNR